MINRYKGEHMKVTKLYTLIILMLVPVLAHAQWVHDETFQAHQDSLMSMVLLLMEKEKYGYSLTTVQKLL